MLSAHKNKFIEYNKERYMSSLVLKCQVSVSLRLLQCYVQIVNVFKIVCTRGPKKYSVCIVGHIFPKIYHVYHKKKIKIEI